MFTENLPKLCINKIPAHQMLKLCIIPAYLAFLNANLLEMVVTCPLLAHTYIPHPLFKENPEPQFALHSQELSLLRVGFRYIHCYVYAVPETTLAMFIYY